MNALKGYPVIGILLLAFGLLAVPAASMINPAAGYCTELRYQYADTIGADGSMTGSCVLPGGQSVDAWQFLQGKVSPELGYCRQQGLEVRTVTDPAVCGMLGSTCAVCVKADGSVQEVTAMMGLDFREKICSGDICCDPVIDRTCFIGQEPGTGGESGGAKPVDWALVVLIAVIAVLVIAGIAFFLLKKNNGSKPEKKNP
jgi:putative hemolysin